MMSRIYRYNMRGLTLIEVMVAVVIGLLAIEVAIELFISNQRIYREQEMMGRLQESARFTMDTLLNDIQSAGHIGCADRADRLNINNFNDTASLLNFVNPIEGSERVNTNSNSNWQPSNNAVGNFLRGDGITVRYLADIANNLTLLQDMNASTDALQVSLDLTIVLNTGELVAVADCNDIDIFPITTIGASTISHDGLSRAYTNRARLYRVVARRYFIGTDPNTQQPALRVQQYQPGQTVPTITTLVDGVEDMQILYGERGANPQFATATSVVAWDNVFAVRIASLFRTIDEDASFPVDSTGYQLLNATFTAPGNDRRRRRIFSSTALIRNRL